MKNKKKIILIIAICTILMGVIGHVIGAAVFLQLSKIPIIPFETLKFNTLELYFSEYKEVKEIKKLIGIGYLVNAVFALFPILITMIVIFSNKEKLHGDAKFATDIELRDSGLFSEKEQKHPAILLGKIGKGRYKGKYIKYHGQQFAGVGAPTRSGKGVSIVLPNLCCFPDSIVNLDIKLENYTKTAGFRKRAGQEVYLFSPAGFSETEEENKSGIKRSHRWNPFHYVRRDEKFRVGDLIKISSILYPVIGDPKNDIWAELSGKIFIGLALYMLDNEEDGMPVTLPKLLELTTPSQGLEKWCESVINTKRVSEQCIAELTSYIKAPNETRGSIYSNLVAPLAILKDKVTSEVLSGNDFDLRDLRRKRMTIYVCTPPDTIATYKKLLNLFFEQVINLNTQVEPSRDPSLKYQCLMLLDEFTSIGKVRAIQQSCSFTASYNLRYLFVYQTKGQLESEKEGYGKEGARVLLENTGAKIYFPESNVTEEVKRISETLGYKTVKVKTKSRTRGKGISHGENTTEQKRALMLPQEVVEFGYEKYTTKKGEITDIPKNTLVFCDGTRPFKAEKIVSFDDPIVSERIQFSLDNPVTVPLLNI